MNITQFFRIMFRNKTYSILNIMGLAVGITCAALILLWVEDEMTYNDVPKQKQLYALFQNQRYSEAIYTFQVAPNPLAAVLKEEISGIRNVMRYSGYNTTSLFTLNDKMLYEWGIYADSSIFSMLDIEFVRGSATTAFEAAYPLVISENMALRFFGDDNPLGQTLKKDNGQEYQVTAVVKNLKRTDFSFSWLIPFQQLVKDYVASGWEDAETTWKSNWMSNYVELEMSADINRINSQIRNLLSQKLNESDESVTLFLYPIQKLRLYGEFKDGRPTGSGYIRYVRLFFWIAVVILVIACINFMNLSTARSQKRIMEVGLRKTFGAGRFRLIRQFMFESGTITLVATLLSIVFIALILPQFNLLTGKQLTLEMGNPVHWIGLLCIGLICSIMAGSYPAFFLSSFPPIDVLRKLKAKSGASSVAWLRRGLIVFQFTASLVLIICTAFIYLQVRHTKNRSLGMDIEQVIMSTANQDIQNHFEPLKQELLATGVVESVGMSSQSMLNIGNNGGGWKWQGKPEDVNPLVSGVGITDDLFPTLNITFYDGRNFDHDNNAYNIIINKAFADLMGEEGRIGGQLWRGDDENMLTIVGIINDFVYNNVYGMTQQPAVFWMNESADNLFIRLKPGDMQSALQKVEYVIKQINPNHPFEYVFMDEQFKWQFRSTLLTGKLAGLFAALAIFISCLGLFGLTAFSIEQRFREIGIRKVLGASVLDIVGLLGHNFMLLIGMAFVIAIPVAWWIVHGWLQSYEYRIPVSWWVFAGSGLLVILIAMLTMSFQAIKAATADPVKAIQIN